MSVSSCTTHGLPFSSNVLTCYAMWLSSGPYPCYTFLNKAPGKTSRYPQGLYSMHGEAW